MGRTAGGIAIVESSPAGSVLRGPAMALAKAGQTLAYQPPSEWWGHVALWVRVTDDGAMSTTDQLGVTVLPALSGNGPRVEWRGAWLSEASTALLVDEDSVTSLLPQLEGGAGGGLRVVDARANPLAVVVVNITASLGSLAMGDCGGPATNDSSGVLYASSPSASATDGDCESQQVRLAGTLAHINGQLAKLLYRPPPDYHGHDAITVTVGDGQAVSTLRVEVASVNDPPTIAIGDGPMGRLHGDVGSWPVPVMRAQEDVATLLRPLITIADVDAGDVAGNALAGARGDVSVLGFLELQLSVRHGTLSGTDLGRCMVLDGSTTGSRSLTLRGDLASLNGFLASLSYLSDPQWFGTDLLSVYVDDLGNSGKGGPMTHERHALIDVVWHNHPPSIVLPSLTPLQVGTTDHGLCKRLVRWLRGRASSDQVFIIMSLSRR